jgi:hypothetical protein
VLAAAAAALSANGFTAIRLLSQTLFGELPVLLGWASTLLWRRRSPSSVLPFSLAVLALLTIYAKSYHHEPRELWVRRHGLDRSGGAVTERRLRIVHLSDLQADQIGTHEKRALRTAMAQQPDLIVMTGDYIQPRLRATRPLATSDLNQLLRELTFDAPVGAFATRGDVDVDWPMAFAGTPVITLSGESVRLTLSDRHSSLTLIGLTPGMSHGRNRKELQDLVRRAPPADLRIVAGHAPDFVAQLVEQDQIDLALAGHTHGGQVVLPLLGALYTKSTLPRLYASGFRDFRGIPLNVSAGIGMERGTAPQIRFLCPPEISLIDLRF